MKAGSEKIAFLKASEKIGFDKNHRKTIKYNIAQYDAAVEKGINIYSNLELARNRAGHIKYKVLNDLDKYLIEFEDNFTKNGGKVIWATNATEANREINKILKHHGLTKMVKSKSMITEEIELNKSVEKKGVEVNETDLGEFIVQQAGQKPYHIVTPAMHMSKENVADLYEKKFDVEPNLSPEDLTQYTRELLREKFIHSDVGVSGANFLIADTGSIALTENEGNAMLSMSFPKVHIAISGIEKVIPNLEDLDLYWPLLSTHGTGQALTTYNSIISGPRTEDEIDGPQEMYVVLIDNGRTNLLEQENQRQALSCIKCGACLNVCPVYQNIGGHTYNTTYSGPIGAVTTPYLSDFKKFKHLSFASSLCGKCTSVCPVKIPLHELLLLNRNDAVKRNTSTFGEKQLNKWSTMVLTSRKLMDFTNGNFKSFLLKQVASKSWGPRREFPKLAPKSFAQMWKEQEEEK